MKRIQSILGMLALVSVCAFTSCVKKDFDAPPDPGKYDPNLPVSGSLAKVKALLTSAAATPIDSDWTIAATVVANDRSGNLYKQIVIDDGTAGMTLLLEANNLYGDYPVGRKVYLKTKGLYIGTYSNLPQIGMVDETNAMIGVPSTLIGTYVVKGDYPHDVLVDTVSLADIKTVNPNLLNRLVYIKDVEFSNSDLNKTYAQPSTIASGTSRTVEDCNGNNIIMRTSGYANFQSVTVPGGKGGLLAIYTVYGSTPQLVLRDTNDVQFTGARCGGGGGPVPPSGYVYTIDSLRKLYTGSDYVIPAGNVAGVVISDRANGNTSGPNVIIQDGSGKGILVYYGGTATYNLGDSILIDVAGNTLTMYQGAMELKAKTTATTTVATGKSVTPTQVTIGALNGNFTAYESTLVKIVGATITGGATYGGNRTLNDGTGTISLYTATAAVFAGQSVPSGTVTVQGIATPYTAGNEIKMRNPAIDVY